MKRIALYILLLSQLSTLAQDAEDSKYFFNYQAAVRSKTGTVVANEVVEMRISLVELVASNTASYSEIHRVKTNQFGVVNFKVGNGQVVLGKYSDIGWDNGPIFLRVELKHNNQFENLGYTQLTAMPYALHAKTASSIDYSGVKNAPEVTDFAIVNDEVLLTFGAQTFSIDLKPYKEDLVTQVEPGLMSAADKVKLDNITKTATQTRDGLMTKEDKKKIDDNLVDVSQTNRGLMTKEDKKALDDIKADYVKKSDIVDNLTSTDTDKPVSAKQAHELDKRIGELEKANAPGILHVATSTTLIVPALDTQYKYHQSTKGVTTYKFTVPLNEYLFMLLPKHLSLEGVGFKENIGSAITHDLKNVFQYDGLKDDLPDGKVYQVWKSDVKFRKDNVITFYWK